MNTLSFIIAFSILFILSLPFLFLRLYLITANDFDQTLWIVRGQDVLFFFFIFNFFFNYVIHQHKRIRIQFFSTHIKLQKVIFYSMAWNKTLLTGLSRQVLRIVIYTEDCSLLRLKNDCLMVFEYKGSRTIWFYCNYQ